LDFGRIFEGVGSLAESVHAGDWSKQHQGRRGLSSSKLIYFYFLLQTGYFGSW
jgi:hypothetical protein